MPKDIKCGKDIKDYLHLYLGCECRCYSLSDSNGWIDRVTPELLIQIDDEDSGINGLCLILRPLSDMTEEEAIEICKTVVDEFRHDVIDIFEITKDRIWYIDGQVWGWDGGSEIIDKYFYFHEMPPEVMRILLSKGFDLFNLINEGLAIDATKMQKA